MTRSIEFTLLERGRFRCTTRDLDCIKTYSRSVEAFIRSVPDHFVPVRYYRLKPGPFCGVVLPLGHGLPPCMAPFVVPLKRKRLVRVRVNAFHPIAPLGNVRRLFRTGPKIARVHDLSERKERGGGRGTGLGKFLREVPEKRRRKRGPQLHFKNKFPSMVHTYLRPGAGVVEVNAGR